MFLKIFHQEKKNVIYKKNLQLKEQHTTCLFSKNRKNLSGFPINEQFIQS